MTRKTEVFEAYGDNADDALRNWQQIDPAGHHLWSATVERRQYLADYRRWSSRRRLSVDLDALTADAGQAPLFDAPTAKRESIHTRPTVVHDGTEHTFASLSGHEGAATLRQAALRDLNRAESTSQRCRFHLKVAEVLERETERVGHPVTVAEVLHLAVA